LCLRTSHIKAMRDLFGHSPVPGLQTAVDILPQADQADLIDRCRALDMTPYVHKGYEGKRLVRRFGWHPDSPREPIPDWLLSPRAAAALAFGRDAETFAQALVNRYDPGAGIGWHRDRPPYREVIGISLGAPADMAFRRRLDDGRFERASLPLLPGSAYLLSGPARSDWQHGIARHEGLRFSLTFRSR
jgi:alkylated DNA repair dioxygenase AlkB